MKIVKILFQEIIKCLLFFTIAYIWLKFSLNSKVLAIILSIAISLFLEFITLLISKKQLSIKDMKLSQQKSAEDMFFSLVTNKTPLEFYYNLFKSRHKDVSIKDNYLLVKTHNAKKSLYFPFLKLQSLTIDDIIEITHKEALADKIIILCNDYIADCKDFISSLSHEIKIYNKYETYISLYQEYDFYPEISLKQNKKNFNFKELFTTLFNKSNIKGYIISGTILLISSFYVASSIYYKVVASILFLFALICILNANGNTLKKKLL